MPKRDGIFRFKQFSVSHKNSTMKIGTDAVLLGAWVDLYSSFNILEIGTGCGVISLMMAQRNDKAIIQAIDIDESSVMEATMNFENSPWSSRLKCNHTSLQELSTDIKFDHIVSNPPYFIDGTTSPIQSRLKARHVVTLTFEELIFYSKKLLLDKGKLSIIIPYEHKSHIIELAKNEGLLLSNSLRFISKKDVKPERSILTFINTKEIDQIEKKELIHYNEQNEWSDDYITLTKDFYTIL